MAWYQRVPAVTWVFLGALAFNLLTYALWPAVGAIGCDELRVPTTTAHPNGSSEDGYESLCAPGSFGSVFVEQLRDWPIYNLLWALMGGQLFLPGNYDWAPFLGWSAWVLGWLTVGGSTWVGRRGAPWAWAWRVPVALLSGALVSMGWLDEWESFD